jgi:hypothetical protein
VHAKELSVVASKDELQEAAVSGDRAARSDYASAPSRV